MRDIADLGLSSKLPTALLIAQALTCLVAYDLVNNFASSSPDIANQFYQQYLVNLLGDILYVLTDADHKSGKLLPSQFKLIHD